jgi:RNA polymerase sigma factor (sigma-70 family)
VSLDLSTLGNGELAALSTGGCQGAYAEIMRRHRGMIYRIVLGNIGNAEEAPDLVQETFIAAHRALGRYDASRPMRRWLATIALNKCRDWRRQHAVRRLFAFALPLDASSTEIADDKALPDTEAAARAEVLRVAGAIAELPEALREPLMLDVVQDLSQAETAAILGITEKVVETGVRRARAKLSEWLEGS